MSSDTALPSPRPLSRAELLVRAETVRGVGWALGAGSSRRCRAGAQGSEKPSLLTSLTEQSD